MSMKTIGTIKGTSFTISSIVCICIVAPHSTFPLLPFSSSLKAITFSSEGRCGSSHSRGSSLIVSITPDSTQALGAAEFLQKQAVAQESDSPSQP
ncbi:hypothetical protein OWV82_008838 [Melia azedarach]|uniref:Uncharacterized protein n=1 Tax=Melia azedarach TaxID=155640 RepID=A0ACC1YC12_MELAZ|nr:hypothetical protein OWV82_008838 [Melia azedarach]